MSLILAIDPGSVESGWCVVDADTGLMPDRFGKTRNADLLAAITEGMDTLSKWHIDHFAIEMVASYGMPVGADVFETCVWIGRFDQAIAEVFATEPALVYRKDVKLHHCNHPRANDATIRQALVDRFAPGQRNHGKGTKAEPGWFYGFHSDIWAAYALAVYAADQLREREQRAAEPAPF